MLLPHNVFPFAYMSMDILPGETTLPFSFLAPFSVGDNSYEQTVSFK